MKANWYGILSKIRLIFNLFSRLQFVVSSQKQVSLCVKTTTDGYFRNDERPFKKARCLKEVPLTLIKK